MLNDTTVKKATNPCRLATHSIHTNQSRFTCQNSSPALDQRPSGAPDQAGKQGFSWREGCRPGGHNPQPAETLTTLTLTYGDCRIRTGWGVKLTNHLRAKPAIRHQLWRLSDSNQLGSETHQPPASKARADNPYGDYRIRTDDPLLAKQVLYQLS